MAKNTKQRGKARLQKKSARQQELNSSEGMLVEWRFDRIDRAGKFAFDLEREEFRHKYFLEKMIGYSSMTWAQVRKQTHDDGKSKHHFIDVDGFSKEAIERFYARQLEEYADSIFSFAFDNMLRIIGIRENEHFYVLWYDPRHEICPSKKKHT